MKYPKIVYQYQRWLEKNMKKIPSCKMAERYYDSLKPQDMFKLNIIRLNETDSKDGIVKIFEFKNTGTGSLPRFLAGQINEDKPYRRMDLKRHKTIKVKKRRTSFCD